MTISTDLATLVTVLRDRADRHPEAQACLYLGDGEEQRGERSYAELDRRARAVAARLQGLIGAGDCAILLYPPGLDFFDAFFGCLYADVIAVPLPVPRLKASVTQFAGIVRDLKPRVVMTTAATLTRLARLDLPELTSLIALTTEDTPAELARAWRAPVTTPDAVAYLQYTSGSTSQRKGVIVRHKHAIANLRGISERFGHHADSVSVNWLPHIHDLGLVSGMLQPLYHGHPNVLMSPNAFVQQPIRWLDAITQYRGTYSNSPNFGFDLCVRRTTPAQRARLDLTSWLVALNGAEPVRQQTVDQFTAMFAPCGFRRETMLPAYGLAEATLVVSAGLRDAAPITLGVDPGAFERDRIVAGDGPERRALVGCGHALPATTVAIVDPATRRVRGENEIGEIWASGPGVAGGYWQRPDDTAETFEARVEGDESGATYLRTGDLGFLRGGELFITGRLKDLIIVRGFNHYPQDIEWTIEQCHEGFRPGCCAAFSIDDNGEEQLVVAVELEREHLRNFDGPELERLARRAVAEQHDLRLHALALLRTGTVPRTSSGKIQRRQCRADFLSGALSAVWNSPSAAVGVEPAERPRAEPSGAAAPAPTANALCEWLREYAGERINSRLMDERRAIAPHVVLDFGNAGVLGLLVPTLYGGLGFGYRDSMRVLEQLGAIDQTLTMMTIVHNVLGIGPILHHGDAHLKSTWLPTLARGRELVAFALTEPGAGSNPQAMAATAVPDGDGHWRLQGQKCWSGSAGWASVVNVFVQNLDVERRPHGISAFAVPRTVKGLRIGPEALTLGMRGMVQNTVFLEGARVSREHALGEIGGGMKVAHDAMMQGRLAIGAACVGGMKRCLQLLVRYAERRTIATGRLLDNPVLLERAGAWTSALSGLEGLVGCVADRLDRGDEVPIDAYVVCKVAGAEWFCRAADDLVQFLGGRGYIETNIAAQLLRDARVTRILEGPSEALTMFLGSRLAHDPADLCRFLEQAFGAAALATRLRSLAETILARSVEQPRAGSDQDARRWAYALIGEVAVDAVLLAATPPEAMRQHSAWAAGRFEATVAAALAKAGDRAADLVAADLLTLTASHVAAIGDVEQALAGEEHDLDRMLRRDTASAPRVPAVTAAASEPVVHEPRDTSAAPADPVTDALPQADASVIEQFIVRFIQGHMKLRDRAIDPARSVFDYGLDSVTGVMLVAAIEDTFNRDLNPEMVYDTPVIRDLAAAFARQPLQ